MISWQKLADHHSETIAIIGEVTLDASRLGLVMSIQTKSLFFISCTIRVSQISDTKI